MAGLKTILFIEDDRLISELYARALSKAGYSVKQVVTGPNGLKEAKTGKYDLILLDIMIPDITGMDVLKELRGKDGSGMPNTKIVITTNLSQDDDSRAALEAQADGYLVKADITPKKLVAIVKQIEESGNFKQPAKEKII